jgi:hypothetical protein
MTDSETLPKSFEKLQEEALPSLGMDDPLLMRIVSARLLIERVGERDANYWWDSQVLSEFGQDTLEETVPRTAIRSQIELAMKVGQKVEHEMIDGEAISLFDLGPFVESQIQHEIDQIDGDNTLDILTEQSVEITETGWTEPLLDEETTAGSGMVPSYEIGSVSLDDLQEEELLENVVSHLIRGYGETTKQDLKIPYYSPKQ